MLEFPWQPWRLHLFRMGNYYLLFDVASSSLFSIDEPSFFLLEKGQNSNLSQAVSITMAKFGEQASEISDELERLHEEGVFLAPDPADDAHFPPFHHLKALCLNIAQDCNMHCDYCFATTGSYGERGLMSKEVAKKAIDYLLFNSGPLEHLEMDFFGGEPLLNFPILKEAVLYGEKRALEEKKEIRFTCTTNTLLLREPLSSFLNEHKMRVVLSIDGRKEDHDLYRHLKNGQGSQSLVLERIINFLDSRKRELYFLRGTFTSQTLNFLSNVLYLNNLGYSEISFEPVVAREQETYAIKEEHLPAIINQYEELAKEVLRREKEGKELHFFHFEVDLAGISCVAKRLAGCGAGVEYLAVTPSGKLYPCHQFVGRPGFELGTLEEGITNFKLYDLFCNLSFLKKESCCTCWARYLCSGGCHANHHLLSGDVLVPDPLFCQMIRKRMECALFLKAARKELNEL